MVEQGNDIHRRIVYGLARLDPAMQNWVHAVANTPGGVVPPPSLLEKAHAERIESDEEEEATVEDHILDPTTGGRIYAKDATAVVYKYVATHSENRTSKPLFEHTPVEDGKSFQCSVIFPKRTPLETFVGPIAKSKNEARRLACYQACLRLYELGHLNHTLFPRPPIIRSFLPDIYADFDVEPDWEAKGKGPKVPNPLANIVTDTNGQVIKGKTAGTRCYARKRPVFWKNSLHLGFGGRLFATVVDIDLSEITTEKFRTMTLLTRHPLPHIEPFRIFYSGFSIEVSLQRCEPINVSDEEVETLLQYTTRVFRSIGGKPFENTLERTPYFVVPMKADWMLPTPVVSSQPSLARPTVEGGIAWDEVKIGAKMWFLPLKPDIEDLEAELDDAVLQDRKGEFARRFDAVRLRRDLSPKSKPEGLNVRALKSSLWSLQTDSYILSRKTLLSIPISSCARLAEKISRASRMKTSQ